MLIAEAAGVTPAEVEAIAAGPSDASWSAEDAVVLRAADELHDDAVVSDATWAALAGRYDDRQLIELVMLVGHYHMIAFTLNSLGVQVEPSVRALEAEA